MSDWSKLGSVGIAKVISSIPRGGGEEGTMFAFKIKKVKWSEGKYCMDVIVRTPDLGVVLASKRWDLYPSMLPDELQSAIDCDVFDDSWFICECVVNERSKTARTKFKLIDTQGGLSGAAGRPADALLPTATMANQPEQEGPSKPAAVESVVMGASPGSERGQPQG
ncbi:unnamed protein product, partial [marine sediment metagenome]